MRKGIVTLIAIAAVLTIGLSAYAQRGPGGGGMWNGGGYGYGHGCGYGYNGGCWNGSCPNFTTNGQAQITPLTEDEARAKVEAYISGNFKGYTVTGMQSVPTRFGSAYVADVKDASGNVFNFFVGQNGFVRGPIYNTNFNNLPQ